MERPTRKITFVNSRYDSLQMDTNIAMIYTADKRVHRNREAYLSE
ncbi:pesticidal crystal cry1Ac domain protein [Bacillus thuringiensis serovar morrisoni]|nr:pesticidal crystal cry1Ac domain protein [Bacillus thuringiensis serovar morrisoni]